mmetsp:Transcript_101760/g.183577  ORF Transcript_101760/g.183577 Transcript_101760/m.183577 type:complete len:300 (-) Transcript_101760:1884-2783(-)
MVGAVVGRPLLGVPVPLLASFSELRLRQPKRLLVRLFEPVWGVSSSGTKSSLSLKLHSPPSSLTLPSSPRRAAATAAPALPDGVLARGSSRGKAQKTSGVGGGDAVAAARMKLGAKALLMGDASGVAGDCSLEPAGDSEKSPFGSFGKSKAPLPRRQAKLHHLEEELEELFPAPPSRAPRRSSLSASGLAGPRTKPWPLVPPDPPALGSCWSGSALGLPAAWLQPVKLDGRSTMPPMPLSSDRADGSSGTAGSSSNDRPGPAPATFGCRCDSEAPAAEASGACACEKASAGSTSGGTGL